MKFTAQSTLLVLGITAAYATSFVTVIKTSIETRRIDASSGFVSNVPEVSRMLENEDALLTPKPTPTTLTTNFLTTAASITHHARGPSPAADDDDDDASSTSTRRKFPTTTDNYWDLYSHIIQFPEGTDKDGYPIWHSPALTETSTQGDRCAVYPLPTCDKFWSTYTGTMTEP